MLSQSVSLFCQARKFLLFSTRLNVGFCSLRFLSAFSVLKTRYICRYPCATSLHNLLRKDSIFKISSLSCRALNTADCPLKERSTSYDKKEVSSTGETSTIPNFISGDLDQENRRSSSVKLRSAVAEYALDEGGFVDIQELVDFLKRENALDICVIKTGGNRRSYVDYFVVVSGVSVRHLRAMAKNLEQLFRGHELRGIGRDGHVVVEGLENDHWVALDIGNIVVHFFLPEVRAVYELEKLWTLGPKYDDQSKAMLEQERFMGAVELGEKLDDSTGE